MLRLIRPIESSYRTGSPFIVTREDTAVPEQIPSIQKRRVPNDGLLEIYFALFQYLSNTGDL